MYLATTEVVINTNGAQGRTGASEIYQDHSQASRCFQKRHQKGTPSRDVGWAGVSAWLAICKWMAISLPSATIALFLYYLLLSTTLFYYKIIFLYFLLLLPLPGIINTYFLIYVR